MRAFARIAAALAALSVCGTKGVAAQEKVTLQSDVLLYGDNTEFRNPFREGETIFGAVVRVAADVQLSDRVRVSLGALGNQRFGSEKAFDLARPVISMTFNGQRSSFVFGTFPAVPVTAPSGPDRGGPHLMVPPIQRETLTFDRPYEAGLEWNFAGARLRHSLWLEWQRINTAAHRERFDGGFNGSFRPAAHVAVPLQVHVVHEGGQLFASGPVHDSWAGAMGVRIHGVSTAAYRPSLELLGLVSKYVQDRSRPDETRDGVGFFGRAALEHDSWRAHVIVWRGRNFLKDEGDPNYLSVRRDGTRYAGTRDYAEAGIARRFALAPSAAMELSGRFHRTERFYEYSYRVLSIISLGWHIR
jgi:hypothetical protein